MSQDAGGARPGFTPKQGQYLAFIYAYTLVNGRPPAQADMQRFFQVTPPTVHQMLLALEKAGLISRHPGAARSSSEHRRPSRPRRLARAQSWIRSTRQKLCAEVLAKNEKDHVNWPKPSWPSMLAITTSAASRQRQVANSFFNVVQLRTALGRIQAFQLF